MRNNCSVLSIIAGICFSGYAAIWIIGYYLFPYLGGLGLLAPVVGFAIAAFFIPKRSFISFPVWLYSISIFLQSLLLFIEACVDRYNNEWSWVLVSLWLAFSVAGTSLMSVIFAKTKPFRQDGKIPVSEEQEWGEPVSPKATLAEECPINLDEIARAKDLLDAGAITPEEFYELKRRAFH